MKLLLLLKSFLVVGLYSSSCLIAMDQKQALENSLLDVQSASDQKAIQQSAPDVSEDRKCRKDPSFWAGCCMGTIVLSFATSILVAASIKPTPPHLFCDNYYLTAQDFTNSPNMTWSVTLDNCCFSSGSQTMFGDGSVFNDRGSQFKLGSFAYDIAYHNKCAGKSCAVVLIANGVFHHAQLLDMAV